jgi:uncharacterized caspase-like protein
MTMQLKLAWMTRLLGLGLLLGASTCFAATPAEQKIALVIGNSAYPSAALKNPVNDAKAMATKLTSLGFEVILRTDAGQRDMTRAVSQFGDKLKGGSIGLFYFAGHGMQVRGKNFLIPVDAEISSESSTRSEAVDVDQVLEQLGSARLSMVILDACRNNPFERRFRSAGNGGLAQIDAPTGTMLAYATAPGKVAFDGTGVNGLYTTELLKALDTPGLKVEDVFKQVRINVLKASDNQQIPWESSSLTGEFYFKPDIKPQLTDINAQQLAKERAELQKSLEEERSRRDQDAKTQAELQRSLAEERKRRDQDAELVRREMETLRKELLALRQSPSAPPTPAPPVTVLRDDSPTSKPANADKTNATQVVLAITSPTINPDSSIQNVEWDRRIDLVEKYSDKLTYSKALALLLDITNSDELTVLVSMDKVLNQMAWPIAHSLGIRADGQAVWSTSTRKANLFQAQETALESCQSQGGQACQIIFANGDIRKKELIELARSSKVRDANILRDRFLQTLKTPPRQSQSREAAGNMSQMYIPQL